MGVFALFSGCSSLPSLYGRRPSKAIENTADTRLGQAIAPLVQAHPGRSGVKLIGNGGDAFAARAVLAEAADRSLDIQYYIWHLDLSGALLFQALQRAADRGVRVRLLLDDNNSSPDLDRVIAALDAHPNIEVRLFNPFVIRWSHAANYLTDFFRLNRRMHNKSFTADNQATIIGGRNVGDEYFGADEANAFVDLDAIAVGPVVREVSHDFDAYWSCGSVYPASGLLPAPTAADRERVGAALTAVYRRPAAKRYLEAVAAQAFLQNLLTNKMEFEWTNIRMVSDDPAKGLGRAQTARTLLPRLHDILGNPKRELQIVSPYFVPTKAGTDALGALAASGVKISVLTNSMRATDVAAVHAGYAKWRKPLLQAGVALYEMKRFSADSVFKDRGFTGSSGSSLHAKTIAIDRERLFVGSFNFDPRSTRHNTEIGFVIDSPTKARELADLFAGRMEAFTYQVRLDDAGNLVWVEEDRGATVIHQREPGAGFWRRAAVGFISLLPVDWLL